MANILLLPVQPHGSDQSKRLHADLAAAHARGEDLGSRAPHIQAGGEHLLELCRQLRTALSDLDQQPIIVGFEEQAAHEALREALQKLHCSAQTLANMAKRF